MLKTVLVTGGGGFLGRNICKLLRAKNYNVHSFSRNQYDYLDKLGVKQFTGDICHKESLQCALEGCDAVIHTAAKAGIWGRKEDFYSCNVEGTKNLLELMKAQSIQYLVYTSSPSVVYAGSDIKGKGEELCYPVRHQSYYAWSKRLAEELVLKENHRMHVLALRPHLIWGPQDPHFIPRMLAKAKSGKLIKVGNLRNLVDVIYVEDAANAHMQALLTLFEKPSLSGNVYFLGGEKPVVLWDFIEQMLSACGQKRLGKKIGFLPAYCLAWVIEKIYTVFRIYEKEPPLTCFLVKQLSTSHYFSHKKAWEDFGYKPAVYIEEGLAELAKVYGN